MIGTRKLPKICTFYYINHNVLAMRSVWRLPGSRGINAIQIQDESSNFTCRQSREV